MLSVLFKVDQFVKSGNVEVNNFNEINYYLNVVILHRPGISKDVVKVVGARPHDW